MVPKQTTLSLLACCLAFGPCMAERRRHLHETAFHQLKAQEGQRLKASIKHAHSHQSSLGMDETHTLQERAVSTDRYGNTHVHFQQQYMGIRVWGGSSITHLDHKGKHGKVTNALVQDIQVNTDTAISKEQALAIADQDLAPKGAYAYTPTIELVVFPDRVLTKMKSAGVTRNAEAFQQKVAKNHMAYHIHFVLSNPLDGIKAMDYMIDAHTGQILQKWNSLQTEDVIATGRSQYSGIVPLHTNKLADGTYELRDLTRGNGGNTTVDMAHQGDTSSGSPKLAGSIFTNTTTSWGDGANYSGGSTTNANGQTAGVDAHYGLAVTWDMYKNVLGRNGIDNKGSATSMRVHFSKAFDNGFWLDDCFCMTFGDGDWLKSLGSVDVVAHEFSHGVCSNNGLGGLAYYREAGCLNEANADIMASFAVHYAYGADGAGSAIPNSIPTDKAHGYVPWTVGNLLGRTIRYMYKPSKDGWSYNAWSSDLARSDTDIHDGSGVGNRMMYFLAQGATKTGDTSTSYLPNGMTGIGNDSAARIWYRALTTYFTPAMTFMDARNACIRAAQDLFGENSTEEAAVWNAFAGVNVGKVWTGPSTPTVIISVAVAPLKSSVEVSASQQFTATVTGTSDNAITWTTTGGNISSNGLYTAPGTAGAYLVRATSAAYPDAYAEGVITVNARTTPPKPAEPTEPATPKPSVASASSSASKRAPSAAIDSNYASYWSSTQLPTSTSTQWLAVDLGSKQKISHAKIIWGNTYAKQWSLQYHSGSSWVTVYTKKNGLGGTSDVTFTPVNAQKWRIQSTVSSGKFYQINEFILMEK